MPGSEDYDNERVDDDRGSFRDSSEEDEDEDQDKYEQDDFLVDDDDEDAGEEDAPAPRRTYDDEDEPSHLTKKKKKKKRRHYDDPDLAEGDLLLLEEGGVRGIRKKRLKRLRKGASDEERDEVDEEIRDLARDEDEERFEETRRRAEEPVDYDEDSDDFIDDGGRASRRRRSGPGYVSSEVVRTARSIFGDIDEISQYKGSAKPMGSGEDGDEEDDVDYDDHAERRVGERSSVQREAGEENDLFDEDVERRGRSRGTRSRHGEEDVQLAKGLSGPVVDEESIQKIVATDVPELLQLHFRHWAQAPTETEIREEANWIYRRGFLENPRFRGNSRYESDDVVEKIAVLLCYIHIDNLDIPFIAMYRKEYVSDLLIPPCGEVFRRYPDEEHSSHAPMPPPRGFNSIMYDDLMPGLSFEHLRGVPPGYDDGFGDWSILWLVLDLDQKYAEFSRRKNVLLDILSDDAKTKGIPENVLEDIRSLVHTCDDEKELSDGERALRLALELASTLNQDQIAEDSDDENSRRSKRPSRRKNRYREFCKRGYRSLTKELGINSRQFGENLKGVCDYGAGSQVHVPLESESDPVEAAKLLAIRTGEVTGESSNVTSRQAERVLSAARFILVTEITSDLAVLQATRRILFRPGTVTVSTKPTAQGIAQVDETHPLRCVTSLSERKLEAFKGTPDFALIRRAVDLGFTNVEVAFRTEQIDLYRRHLESSILVEHSSSSLVEQWNEQRRKVVEDVHKILVKFFLAQVNDELEEQTSQVLRQKLTNAASRRFLLGPSRLDNSDGCPRVLAFCVTSEDDEEPDPLQLAKDSEDAREGSERAKHRVAPERITIVDLDENGEYCNGYELFASWLRRPLRNDLPDFQLPKTVKAQLKSIICKSRAQVIIIGVGSGRRAPIRLYLDIVDVIIEMVNKSEDLPVFLEGNSGLTDAIRRASTEDDRQLLMKKLSKYIILCDEAPCRIFAKTNWASAGLSVDGMTLLEKRTVGLARLAQEPLWIYCAIGQEKQHASRLQFHIYHFYAKLNDRLIALQRALVRSVCTVGVDINRSLRLPHTQSMLGFVSGLGFHKASALLKELGNALAEDERGLMSRKHLWSQNYVGRIVFLSAAAFIRVRDPELHSGGSTKRAVEDRRNKLIRRSRNRRRDDEGSVLFDPKDDSRIHPENYTVANKIVDEAVRDENGSLKVEFPDSEYSEELRTTIVVLEHPERLKRLDLNRYADQLADSGRGNLSVTLKLIFDEFNGLFQDFRCTLRRPNPAALFYLVTGADPMLMRVGSAVTATNCVLRGRRSTTGNSISGVSCLLPNGVRGFIKISDFSDETLDDDGIRRLVSDGSSLSTRVLAFNFEKFEAELVSKLSVVRDAKQVPGYVPVVDTQDPAFRPYPQKDVLSKKSAKANSAMLTLERTRRKAMSLLKSRSEALLQHPMFSNISGDQAAVSLRNALPGDILIRPSQYHENEIVFSGKFASLPHTAESRTLLHIPCRVIVGNEGTEGGNSGQNCRYRVDGNSFEHVDQVLDEYVRPILGNLSEAIDHRKFREGSVKELTKMVEDAKKREPLSIPYFIGLSEERPASLVLVFIPGSKSVVTEEIQVVADGYKFRHTLHINMEKLIAWFKQNMSKGATVRKAPPSVREPAGSVYQSPFVATAPSPFRRAASPFRPTSSPYHAPPRSPFVARGGSTVNPVKDSAPPPAPFPQENPLSQPFNLGRGDHGSQPVARQNIAAAGPNYGMDWSRATRQRDEPPPTLQNGNGLENRYAVPRENVRGPDRNRSSGNFNPNWPPPERRIPPHGSRNMANEDEGEMPVWRGQAPVPAWKKQQEAESRQ